jgi:hypothetical protein
MYAIPVDVTKGSMGRARQVPVSTLRYAWEITQTYLGNTYIIYIYIDIIDCFKWIGEPLLAHDEYVMLAEQTVGNSTSTCRK